MFHNKMSGMMFGYAAGGGTCALGQQFKNVGPMGPMGATGPTMYLGGIGPTGATGPEGDSIRGENGATGPTGPKGDTGFAFSPTTLQIILPVSGSYTPTSGGNVTGNVTNPTTLVQTTIGASGFSEGQGVYFLNNVVFSSSIVLSSLQIYYIKTLNPTNGYVTVSLTSGGAAISW